MDQEVSRTIEQKVWDSIEPEVKACYGALVSPLRIPTVIRKLREGTDILSRVESRFFNSATGSSGLTLGMLIAGLSACKYGSYLFNGGDNYLPLEIAAGTNALSLGFEYIRGLYKNSKSKSDRSLSEVVH